MTTFLDIKDIYRNLGGKEEIELKNYIDLNKDNSDFEKNAIIYLPTGHTMNGRDFGHWVCVFRNEHGLNYFDSYGYEIDENIELSRQYFDKHGEHLFPHLSRIFLDEEDKISYNPHKFQDIKKSNHCGQWCAFRLLNKHLDHDEFLDLCKKLKKQFNFKKFDSIIKNF